jgi:hypothetical protein
VRICMYGDATQVPQEFVIDFQSGYSVEILVGVMDY